MDEQKMVLIVDENNPTLNYGCLVGSGITPENINKLIAEANDSNAQGIRSTQKILNNLMSKPDSKQDDIEYWEGCLAKYKAAKFIAIDLDAHEALIKSSLLSRPLKESDGETFDYMLDVLPPLRWLTINNVEMFIMSERYYSHYSTQYAHDKNTDKYYTKIVDIYDPDTWIHTFLAKEAANNDD